MKFFKIELTYALCIVVFYLALRVEAIPDAGFYLPDNINEVTFQYKT